MASFLSLIGLAPREPPGEQDDGLVPPEGTEAPHHAVQGVTELLMDLVDPARGGRLVPIKVYISEQRWGGSLSHRATVRLITLLLLFALTARNNKDLCFQSHSC
jgi:hypothetical protein